MQAGDTLSIYAELYGWYYYGLIWDIFSSTGIALIPIAVVVIGHVMSAREHASTWGQSSESLLAGLETKMLVLLAVMVLAVLPNPATTVSPASYTHLARADVYNEAAENRTNGNTGTTYDQAAFDPRPGGSAVAVSVPPFWYLITQISHGITHAVSQQVDDRGRALEGVRRAMEIAQVKNPDLRDHLNQFYNGCYSKARERYDSLRSRRDEFVLANGDAGLPAALEDLDGVDISKMTSQYFVQNPNYYGFLRTDRAVPGVAYDAAFDVEQDGARTTGGSNCLAFYNLIVGQVQADSDYGKVRTYLTNAARYIPGFADNIDRRIVENYINTAQVHYQTPADKAVSRRKGDYGPIDWLGDAYGAKQLLGLALGTEVFVDSAIYAFHQLRSVMMIIIIMALPIGLVMSAYSVQFLFQASFVVFSTIFLTAIWAIASWAESALAMSLFPSAAEMTSFLDLSGQTGVAAIKKRFAMASATLLFYTMLPVAFGWIMLAAGARAASSVANGLGASGTKGSGSITGVRKAGRGAYGAGKNAVGRFRK